MPDLRVPAVGLATRSRRRLLAQGGARGLLGHPRTAMAIRSSVAATLAWLIAQRIPGASDFAFYAPFGAVATTYTAVVRSTSESLRAVAAIMLGAAVGLAADRLPWTVVAVAVAVALGVVVAGLPWLGASRSYVPVAAMFLLLVGQGQEVGYAVSYAGLFLLGALVTIVLNVAFPTLPLTTARRALGTLREEAHGHLLHMAAFLRGDEDVREAPPRERLTGRLSEARDAVDDVVEAARGNRRARNERHVVERVRRDFTALERVVLLVDDLHDLSDDAPWGTRVTRVAPELRRPMAAALDALSDAVTTVHVADTELGRRRDVDDAVHDLATALLEHQRRAGPDAESLVVATVITTLRRTLSAFTPSDRIHLSPSPWPPDRSDPAGSREA